MRPAQGTVMAMVSVMVMPPMVVAVIMGMLVNMVMVMIMVVGLGRLPRHRRLPASAYAAHHNTSRSLIRNSSPAVTCT